MAKPKIPNQRKNYQALNKRTDRYVSLIERIYAAYNLEAAKIATLTDYVSGETPFRFADYPQTRKRLGDLLSDFAKEIRTVIYRGTSEEWKNSNTAQTMLADKVLKAYTAQVDHKKYNVLYQENGDALKAFQQRTDRGLNLSQKIWEQSKEYKDGLEAALSCAIEKGTSAITLSKQVSKYLQDFPSLQKDYKEMYGTATDIKDCEYRSIRLARTEINMAYRSAENERWKQMDFVVGFEIKRSGREFPCEVCEQLKGKYPKDFVWAGWHPSCRCYQIPILKTEEEFWAWDGRSESTTESVNEVKDVPDGFKRWTEKNASRIERARERGTQPYWVRDNEERVSKAIAEGSSDSMDMVKKADVRQYIQGTEEVSPTVIRNVLEDISRTHPNLLNGSFDKVEITSDFDGYFRVTRADNGKMILDISNRITAVSYGEEKTFCPAKSLNEALTAIAKGEKLTFNQEYAIEGAWHEILHANSKWWSNKANRTAGNIAIVETINQMYARKSYPTFLKALRGTATNFEAIAIHGHGYPTEVLNMRSILDGYSINHDDFYKFANGLIKNVHYDKHAEKLVKWLESKGVKNALELSESLTVSYDKFKILI